MEMAYGLISLNLSKGNFSMPVSARVLSQLFTRFLITERRTVWR